MRLLVGLGNPGAAYAGTRHNVGFMLAEAFLGRHGRGKAREEHGALVAPARWAGEAILVARPMGFMNLSGRPVAAICRAYDVLPSDLVVAYDDADLPLGSIRVRPSGRPSGHGGMASIIEAIGVMEIPRVRMGIGRPGEGDEELADYVLARFAAEEGKQVEEMIARAADAVELTLSRGVKIAMNHYNRRNKPGGPEA